MASKAINTASSGDGLSIGNRSGLQALNALKAEAVAKYAGLPMSKVMLTVERYGNMSSATVPVALVEALEAGRVAPGSLILMPGFGGGLTWAATLGKWGDRVTPLGTSDRQLPPCTQTALEMVNEIRAGQDPHGRSAVGLSTLVAGAELT